MVFVNAAAEELTGRPAAELLALPTVFEVLPEEVHRTVGARIQGAFAGREPTEPFRTELLRADGSRVPIEAAGRALHGATSGACSWSCATSATAWPRSASTCGRWPSSTPRAAPARPPARGCGCWPTSARCWSAR